VTKVVFDDGPLAGIARELADPPLEIHEAGVRYVLWLTDRKGIVHYTVPAPRPPPKRTP
jgi:hypothetical protein